MPQCQVCAHERRHQIEIGLTHRVPVRILARRFGLKPGTVHRHSRLHLSPATKAAILAAQKPSEVDLEALQRSEAEGLLAQLVTQRARLQQLSELSAELGDVRGAVAVERAVQGNLELVGRLLQQFTVVHETRSTSILISADYMQLRSTILRALAPFPDAMRAVAAALHGLEVEAAKDITEAKQPLIIEHKAANGSGGT